MSSFTVSVKDKGRLLIPAALRAQAGLGAEVELIATPLPDGGFSVKTRKQILEALRSPATDLVEPEVIIDFLRSREEAETARHHFLMNPLLPDLSQEKQAEQDATILAKLGFSGSK